ncbi:hypothetical protein [Methylomonas sp. YC3]
MGHAFDAGQQVEYSLQFRMLVDQRQRLASQRIDAFFQLTNRQFGIA